MLLLPLCGVMRFADLRSSPFLENAEMLDNPYVISRYFTIGRVRIGLHHFDTLGRDCHLGDVPYIYNIISSFQGILISTHTIFIEITRRATDMYIHVRGRRELGFWGRLFLCSLSFFQLMGGRSCQRGRDLRIGL